VRAAPRCARAATDMENVLAAHRGAIAAKDVGLAFDLALTLGALLPGRNRTERDAYARTLALSADDGRVVRLLAARGNAERLAGEVEVAKATYEEALARSKSSKDPGLTALAWTGLGVVHQNAGRHLDAIAAYEKALPLAERAKDEELVGKTLGHLGVAHRVVRHDAEALDCSQRAYASHKKTGSTRLLAAEALAMGTVYQQHGEPERARQRYEEASELTREVGDEGLEASVLGTLGTLYGELGEVDLALTHYQRTYEIVTRLGLKRLEGLSLGNLATLYFQLNRFDDARTTMERAVKVIEAAGDELHRGIFTAHLAGILAAQGALKDAESLIVDAEKVLKKRDPHAWGPAVSLQHAWIELAKAKRATSAAEAERWRDSVRIRIEGVPHEASDDVRVNVRMLRLALAAPMDSTTDLDPHALTISEDAALVRTPIGSRIELDRRRNVRLVLKALVDRHASHPGDPLSVDDLLAAGWPGEKVLREAGASRVYVALGTLRKLGLRDAIKSRDGGYLLDPDLKVVVTKPQKTR
jgi:tetratricopeptide (TPR) repeat protein